MHFLERPGDISQVKALLDYGDYPCVLQAFPGTSVAQVMIAPVKYSSLNSEAPSRTLIGSLVFINDLIQALGQEINPEIDTLQVVITLPIIAEKTQSTEFFSLISELNPRIKLGSFGLNADRALYYRYNWQVFQRDLQGFTLLAIINQAYTIARCYVSEFEALMTHQVKKSIE